MTIVKSLGRSLSLLNLLGKTQKKKSYQSDPFSCMYLTGQNNILGTPMNSRLWFYYYNRVAPVATAIDKIISPLIDIPIKIKNKNEEMVDDPSLSVIKFLKKPNCFQTYRSFMKELGTNLLIAGNTFIKLTGDINRPPSEMINVSPTDIEINTCEEGYIREYIEKKNGKTINTYRLLVPVEGNCHRYVSENKKYELIHIKDLSNCYTQETRHYGVSKLQSVFIEIEQLVKAHVFNYSELVRSANVSMVVMSKVPLQKDAYQKLSSDIKNSFSGAERAGSVVVMNGPEIEIKDLSRSIKDMDYKNLKDEINRTIFNRYQIPLAFISEKSMTFNNLATSSFLLYDESIIPTLNIILESLNLYVLPRFGNEFQGWEYFVNRREIGALESRQNERVKTLSQIGVLTQNELRKELGFEAVEGGDVLPLNAFKAIKHFDKEDLSANDFHLSNLYEADE